MNKKNVKTENSYATLFKQKIEGTNNNVKTDRDEKKKGINFDDIDDWEMPHSRFEDTFTENLKENNAKVTETPNSNNIIPIQSKNKLVQDIMNQFNNNFTNEIGSNLYTQNPIQSKVPEPTRTINPSLATQLLPELKKTQANQRIINPSNLNPIQEHINDEFSVNTSYFTNRFGEIGNNVDKIELSNYHNVMGDYNQIQTNVSNKKLLNFNINSSENILPINAIPYANMGFRNKYDIIEEKEEEMKVNQSVENTSMEEEPKKPIVALDDSLEDESDFSLNIKDDMNVTKNQMEDMNKEFNEMKRKIKMEGKKEEVEKKKDLIGSFNFSNKKDKVVLEPIINKAHNNKENIISKPKRKQSPYLRYVNTNANPGENENMTKPVSIQTYQQNTNIMHIQPPMNQLNPVQMALPMQMQMLYNNQIYNNPNMNMMPYQQYPYMPNNNMYQLPVGGLLPNYYPNYHSNFNNVVEITNNINNVASPKDKSTTLQKSKSNKSSLHALPKENTNVNDSSLNRDLSLTSPDKNKLISKQVSYRPKTLKEYKEKFKGVPNNAGGLGANIGTKDWEEKEEKKMKMKEYSENIKSANKIILAEKQERNYNGKSKEIIEDTDKKEEKLDDSLSFFDKKLEKNIDYANVGRILKPVTTTEAINKSGYSHIHNIRKLKDYKTIDNKSAGENVKTKVRPKSSNKYSAIKEETNKNTKNKIYTTLHQNKNFDESRISTANNLLLNASNITNSILDNSRIRPLSTKLRNNNNNNAKKIVKQGNNAELESLLSNHNMYQDKVEKIRNFISKY